MQKKLWFLYVNLIVSIGLFIYARSLMALDAPLILVMFITPMPIAAFFLIFAFEYASTKRTQHTQRILGPATKILMIAYVLGAFVIGVSLSGIVKTYAPSLLEVNGSFELLPLLFVGGLIPGLVILKLIAYKSENPIFDKIVHDSKKS